MTEPQRATDAEPLVISDSCADDSQPPAPRFAASESPMVIGRTLKRQLRVTNMVLGVVCITVCFAATFSCYWRVVKVNRVALKLLSEMGEVEASLLNASIAFTRAQGVYDECRAVDQDVSPYETGYEACHGLTTHLPSANHTSHFHEIVGDFHTLAVLAPFVSVTTVFCLAVDLFAPLSRSLLFRFRLYLYVSVMRGVNLVLAVVAFTVATNAWKLLCAEDPGFPTSWPAVIRKYSYLFIWQWGPILWLVGITCHALSLFIDVTHAVSFYVPRQRSSPFNVILTS